MQDILVAEGQPLSEVERVVDTFIAPSKTFTDILRSASWWLPFLLSVIVSFGSVFAMSQKVGFDAISQHEIERNPKAEERMASLTPEQRASQMRMTVTITKISSYCFPIFILLISALSALVLWASFNFGLGAKTSYGQMFAVWMYASLPRLFLGILNIIFIYAGVNTENFDIRNPVGTNLAYYMPDASPAIKSLLSFFDIFGLWTLALLVIGTAIISRKSKGQAAAVVVGWWVLILLVSVGIAAATS